MVVFVSLKKDAQQLVRTGGYRKITREELVGIRFKEKKGRLVPIQYKAYHWMVE